MNIPVQASDCEKGKEYLQRMRIPADVDWITKKERAYIETGFALYPVSLACAQDDQFSRERRFMKAMRRFVQLQYSGTQCR